MNVPAIGISVSEQIGNRSIVVQTHVDGTCSEAELNAALDRILKAADRQKLYYETREELYKNKANLEQHENALSDMKADLVRVDDENIRQFEDSGRKGPFKLSQAQRSQRATVTKNIEAFQFNIGRLKKSIAEQEQMLKGIGKG